MNGWRRRPRHEHPHWHWHPYRRRPKRLQRQLFWWLVMTIFTTAIAVAVVFNLSRIGDHRAVGFDQVEQFLGSRFEQDWDDLEQRRSLARDLQTLISGTVRVQDDRAGTLETFGEGCAEPDKVLVVERNSRRLGQVEACFQTPFHGRAATVIALFTATGVFWFAAAVLAHKLTHPLSTLIEATRDIGAGNLKRRARLHRGHRNELSMLADAINDMAERIERQLNEQRELLAAVSHEVRSPLARLRLSAELLRENPADDKALDAMDYEVAEIDALIGKLLASSRLDFGSLARTSLHGRQLAATALERRKLAVDLLEDRSEDAELSADPTLLARALDNLLENAEEHGAGVKQLVVRRALPGEHEKAADALVFEVWDRGQGFADGVLARAFEPFFRAPREGVERHASLGLGLSLVQRIAVAHGGRAWAENLESGGARVCFSAG